MTVRHSTFEMTHSYAAPPDVVFAAWADPAAKARWFGSGGSHSLDFRVGGVETLRTSRDGGVSLTFTSTYHDIVADSRIVYASTLAAGGEPATVSLTTVQFRAAGAGTELVLTEQDAFLDGQEERSWREKGTDGWLAALEDELRG